MWHFMRVSTIIQRIGSFIGRENRFVQTDRLCLCWQVFFSMKDVGRIQDLLKGLHATAFNIVYLQDEVYKFKVHEDGKEWSVYGSPVRLNYINLKKRSCWRKLYQWSPAFCHWAFNYNREAGEGLMFILHPHTPSYINAFNPPSPRREFSENGYSVSNVLVLSALRWLLQLYFRLSHRIQPGWLMGHHTKFLTGHVMAKMWAAKRFVLVCLFWNQGFIFSGTSTKLTGPISILGRKTTFLARKNHRRCRTRTRTVIYQWAAKLKGLHRNAREKLRDMKLRCLWMAPVTHRASWLGGTGSEWIALVVPAFNPLLLIWRSKTEGSVSFAKSPWFASLHYLYTESFIY